MATIHEIKVSYGEDQFKLLTATFDIAVAAGAIDAELSDGVRDRLDAQSDKNVRAAQGFIWGSEERQRLKDEFIELDLRLREAIDIRLEEIEAELAPKNASFADFAAAAAAPGPALQASMAAALQAGDEGAALVAFQAARNRDLEMVVAHAATVNERWGDLLGELAEAEAVDLDLEPGDKFELGAQKTPTQQDIKNGILSAPQTNANVLGRMR
jgi:hypothetical protein